MAILKLGEAIKFGTNGNFANFAGTGWTPYPDTPNSTWTVDYVATLKVQLLGAVPRVKMSVDATPFLVEGKISHQEMNIYVNGFWLGFVHAGEWAVNSFILSPSMMDGRGDSVFSFVIPTARIPAKIDAGADQRCLGFAFQGVTFDRA
jgi:hypothetical protein